jgi:hypothetical protein
VMAVVGGCALAKRGAGVGGWAKTRNQAAVARLWGRCIGVVRWCLRGDGGGGGLCARETRGGGGGFGPKTCNRAPVAQLRT